MKMLRIVTREYEAPCGTLLLGATGEGLCLCDWARQRDHHARVVERVRGAFGADLTEGTSPVIDRAVAELDEYFAGERRGFDIPLLFAGTDFQKEVWNALAAIPYGTTVSYGEMARRLGRPKSVRAVANANGANAISIFAPCHRVIGADRSLTGYGGGLRAKACLLALEGAL